MSFLSRLVSRDNFILLLRLVIAGVLIAVIWFTGPKIGFGDARPLAGVMPRLLVILLIIFLLITSLTRWHWSLTLLVIGIVMLWVAGPDLSFGEGFILTGVTTRLLLSGLMLVAWLIYCVYRGFRRRGRFLRPAADNRMDGPTEIAAGMDAMFRQVTRELLQRPKPASRRGLLRGLIQQQEAIPWYLLLGSQGAGKTTAVSQCGQQFPLTETMEPLSVSAGQPEQCRCWLANDAVYLDTDGKYISSAQSSQAEWLVLQSALKSCRPGVAINGVLLMVSAPELMAPDRGARDRLAATLRHRLSELRRIHNQFFPVYLVVTQLDYLCGFDEYFRGLSRQEQQDIWGISFPAGAGESLVSQQADQQLISLVQRIESEINIRLLKEYDPQDRKKMYGFPGDLAVLVQNLRQFLQTLFFPSRYDDTCNSSALRGIYLTSCYPDATCQFINPRTVIRQWADYVNPPAAPATTMVAEAEAEDIRQHGPGHPCFLHQLFCELIIRDQSLATKTAMTFSGPALQHGLKYSALLLLLIVASYGLYRSYHNNAAYLQTITGKTAALREAQERFTHLPAQERPAGLPPLLTGFRNLPDFPGLDLTDPRLSWRFGLFTGTQIAGASDELYRWMLRNTLLPFIRHYSTRQLTLALAERSPQAVYVSLRRYLMVYGVIPADLPFLTGDLAGLWPATAQLSVPPAGHSVTPHLTILFRLPQALLRGPVDEALIRRARAFLAREDAPARIYLRLKNGLSADAPPPLGLRQIAEDSSQPLFELRTEAAVSAIPGLFTRAGYQQVKKKILPQLNTLVREDKIMMGDFAGEETPDQALAAMIPAPVRMYNAVMEHYLSEYVRTWQHYLADIRLRTSVVTGSDRQADEQLGQLAAIGSPLFTLLQRSVSETTLAGYPATDSEKSPLTADAAGVRQGLKALNAARQSELRRQVDNRFKLLRYFVRADGRVSQDTENCQTDTPLCQLRTQLEELQLLLSAQRAGSEKASPDAIAELITELMTRSAGWPLPVRNIVLPLLKQIDAGNRQAATARISAGIAAGPAAYCRNVLAGRYPFIRTAREVSREDFERFFAGEESAGAYFDQNLAGKTGVPSPSGSFGDTARADGEDPALKMFSSARQIRQAFFPGRAMQMSLPIKISVSWLSPVFSRLELRSASQRLSYTHGPVRQTTIDWPATGSDPSITLSLTFARTGETRTRRFTGPWALFRWLDSAQQLRVTLTGEVAADFGTGDGSSAATLQIAGLVFQGESLVTLLRRFTCP